VEAHPHPKALDRGEIFLCELVLRIQSSLYSVANGAEGGTECITYGLKDVSVMRFDCATQNYIVPFDRILHRLAVMLPTLGRAFDVGK
jgi:hypothetical protein